METINTGMPKRFILASESRYRQALLKRLHLPFDAIAANIDETPQPDESAIALAKRLAKEKAIALAQHYPDALILAADQVADLNGYLLGRPGGIEQAVQQLSACSGQQVHFYTALALHCAEQAFWYTGLSQVTVTFRALHQDEILFYLNTEQPYDCAGSFKVEGLGISLMTSVDSDDPTSLVGLPLIEVINGLAAYGISPLQPPTLAFSL